MSMFNLYIFCMLTAVLFISYLYDVIMTLLTSAEKFPARKYISLEICRIICYYIVAWYCVDFFTAHTQEKTKTVNYL